MRKVKLTFVLPRNLQKELRGTVIAEDYGMRGKSTWIIEAIEGLFKLNNYHELVNFNAEMKGFEIADTIVVPRDIKLQLDNAVLEIRKQYPILEGVQSKIIRAAIVHRLLKSI